jgi:hypothetical protein
MKYVFICVFPAGDKKAAAQSLAFFDPFLALFKGKLDVLTNA